MGNPFNEKCPECGEDCNIIDRRRDEMDDYDLGEDNIILYYTCQSSSCRWSGLVSENTEELLSEDFFGG